MNNLVESFQEVVGRKHVLITETDKQNFLKGYRYGAGEALAVVRPGSLLQLWRIVQLCLKSHAIIVMQAANTSLTGGATPHGVYDREVVLVETLRLRQIHILGKGEQVVCHPGATLHCLGQELEPYGRDPHSELGSSCLGASVMGGVCNNSGGALVRRGPAYTEAALYARVNGRGELDLVNDLDIDLGCNPEEILRRLEDGEFEKSNISRCKHTCSAERYIDQVSKIDDPSPARFNANPEYLHSASGSAGRIIVFAVRLDTFPKSKKTRFFHIATNSADDLTLLRRSMLKDGACVPISAEYLSKEVFDLSFRYGKDTFLAVRYLGTHRLPALFRFRRFADRVLTQIKPGLRHGSDRVLQFLSKYLFPAHLDRQLRRVGEKYAHHLFLKVDDEQTQFIQDLVNTRFCKSNIYVQLCSETQARDLALHRFAAAGAAIRYSVLNERRLGELIALDVALPRNTSEWNDLIPNDLRDQVDGAFLYGHFFCHVFHLDIVLKRGTVSSEFKERMLGEFEDRGAECPAEHNVGHLYKAKPELCAFYRELDPTNSLNPGIGQTSRNESWA
ncbi:D-lactate dehydrogenase [Kineobactrum salinum]|uniref:D-lactate dehydrogenase n=1 Tax=Kineobactrum salinum TaxID=2708301 RepID=A0A6C0U1G3_9GAMM|nr:D-lactate dehydrogenase [Kineobactrum salinum]QIB65950.1 D-lactate dehydrogenase [Kineobactrum salinum]